MTEQILNITEKVGKNNKSYKNINLKDISISNYIIVEKNFAEGLKVQGKFGDVFSIGVKYKDETVSFWLNAKQHDKYKVIGGMGDKVKITAVERRFVNPKTKITMLLQDYEFEKVQ